ncbi:DUF1971 domain-containing protein [Roseibium aggregatum]|uniref:DUF1971 domain-containing protein n=1 Tax=Roseibium aggregatum TaxID=187304 RepID=A0A939EJA3_9HYPH|nr:DUF1971 domain-containing protein [Roseibium aggregatum]MBN9672684.1 DUF1971 domain-containing protein [Roseibium aggregatum]
MASNNDASGHSVPSDDTGPQGLVSYRKTQVYCETTLPEGFRNRHSTKSGVWGVIHVLEGRLIYRCWDSGAETVIVPGQPKLVLPQAPHSVSPDGQVRFFVEFKKRSA